MTDADVKPMIYRLLIRLRAGGSLVCVPRCAWEEIAAAKAEDRFTVDSDGFVYVWRPEIKRAGIA